jgi:acid phosphatase type 7
VIHRRPLLELAFTLAALVCVVVLGAAGCNGASDPFGAGNGDDDTTSTPADDDDSEADDDATPTADDDSGDDDSSPVGDDDDSAPAYKDPCGTIYVPQGGYDTDPPVAALYTDQGVGADPTPLRVRTSFYLDSSTSVAVQWDTDMATTASVIEWGEAQVDENRKLGATFVLGPKGGTQARVHEARLCDLAPGTTLQYRVGVDGAFSDTYTYTTIDPAATELTILVVGDSRGGNGTLADLVSLAVPHDPQLVIHTGDMVNAGSSLSEWADLYDHMPELATTPMVSVHGNHEYLAEEFFGMVASPGDEEYFSLDIGPVHLAVLNDSRDPVEMEAQAAWLDQDLAKTSATFTVLATHKPMYSSGTHGGEGITHGKIVPVLDDREVDLVLCGHDHGYERTLPLCNEAVIENAADGTTHVTAGGGGAYLYTFVGDWFTAHSESVHHMVIVTVSERVLTLTAVRHDGSVMDEFVLDLDA